MPTFNPQTDSIGLTGKIALVTGGNTGVGYETVKHLAKRGAKVYLGTRNEQKGEEAIAKLHTEGVPEDSLELFLVDLSSLKDVQRAVRSLATKEDHLDILVNNAAILAGYDPRLTREGLQDVFATNYFGLFLLTTSLLPLLKRAALRPGSDVRIVNLGSDQVLGAPLVARLESLSDIEVVTDLGKDNSRKRYGLSKLLVVWFGKELQKRLDVDNTEIIVLTADPGEVASSGVFDFLEQQLADMFGPGVLFSAMNWLLHLLLPLVLVTPEVGSISSQFAATATTIRKNPEAYKASQVVRPGNIKPWAGQCVEDKFGVQLWTLSEKVVQEVLTTGSVVSHNMNSVNLSGKTALVTGGNRGVGYETVKYLAARGAKVYIGCRDEQKGLDAISKLRSEGVSAGLLDTFVVDLSSIRDVQRASRNFAVKEDSLDILVNNGAIFGGYDPNLTAEGIEDVFATNYFGLFLLTTSLLPLLRTAAAKEGSDVRIVNLGSHQTLNAPPVTGVDSLEAVQIPVERGEKTNQPRYGVSKLLVVWFTKELQRRLDDEGSSIITLVADPGQVATTGVLNVIQHTLSSKFGKGIIYSILTWLVWTIIKLAFVTPETGSASSRFAAASPEVRRQPKKYKARLIVHGKAGEWKGQAAKSEYGKQLWALSERVVTEVLEKGTVHSS